jgi:hypothetical protein
MLWVVYPCSLLSKVIELAYDFENSATFVRKNKGLEEMSAEIFESHLTPNFGK